MCIATAADGSPATVTSYEWIAVECYIPGSCFYGIKRLQTEQNITGNNLLAKDTGRAYCSAVIGGSKTTSGALILQISGTYIGQQVLYAACSLTA